MLPGKLRAELLSLSAENGEVVAKQLVMMERLLGSDDEKDIQLAHEFGRAASNRAGRVAVVRRVAGKAALANKDFAEAKRHFSAALRLSGLVESKIRLAECETGLGRPRKALEILGEIRSQTLSQKEVADALLISAEAREALGQNDAARVTLSLRAETFLTESLARDETDPEIKKIADRWLALKKRL
jgi:tetratricopeptide (TPR) repeat protein